MFVPGPEVIVAGGILLVVAVFLNLFWLSTRYQRARPNEALVIYGRGPVRVIVGGGAFVWPFFMEAKRLSLAPMQLDVTVEEPASPAGPAVRAEVRAQCAIPPSAEMVARAADRFTGSAPQAIEETIRTIVEARLRDALRARSGQAAVAADGLAAEVGAAAAQDLAAMGIELLLLDAKSISVA